MDELFKSIYLSIANYRKIVAREIGNENFIFADDIVADCVLKIMEGLNNGKIILSDIQYKETKTVNHSFFTLVLINKCRDYKRLKRNRYKFVEIEENKHEAPTEYIEPKTLENKIDIVNLPVTINKKLTEYSKQSATCNFHAQVFKYIYVQDINVSKLARESGVSRYVLRKSKNYIVPLVKDWIKEEAK